MKLLICANISTERHIMAARNCIDALVKRCGAEFRLPEEENSAIFGSDISLQANADEDFDFVIAVGGDGTVLRAAQYAVKMDKPLLGINNGRLGYLCGAQISDVEKFDRDSFSNMKKSERTLLSFRMDGKDHFVLNDVVVTKYNMGVSVQMEVSYRGEVLADWRCDGVIISTPTGSTAYNFSAGGPKLLTDTPCFVITPICPHNVNTRSIVVDDNDPITVSVTERANKRGYVFADGAECGEINEELTVMRYHKKLTLLTH